MSLELEILQYNRWEHFKREKDLDKILPVEHPKRVKLRKEYNKMVERIHEIKNEENES